MQAARYSPGLRGVAEHATSKVLNPQRSVLDRMGAVKSLIEAENEGSRLRRSYEAKTFGDLDLDALERWADENPGALQIPRKLREGRRLTERELELYRSNQETLDRFMLGDENAHGFYRLLSEVRAARLPKKDRGPRYYPRRFETQGDYMRLVAEQGFEKATRIRLRNLEVPRSSEVIPADNFVRTARSYLDQVVKRQVLKPEVKRLTNLAKQLEESGARPESARLREWIRHNVMNERSGWDSAVSDFLTRRQLEEPVGPGFRFDSSGTIGPRGRVEVVREVQGAPSRPGKPAAPLFEVRVDGQLDPVHRSRAELLAMKYADTRANPRPVSHAVNVTNRLNSLLVLAGNVRAGVTATTANLGRTLSGIHSPADLAHGVRQVSKYITGKIDPAKLAEWEDVGVMDAGRGELTAQPFGERAATVAEKLAFWTVTVPDRLAKVVAYEEAAHAIAREHPTWSAQRVRTEATYHASIVTDIGRRGTRSPFSFEPLAHVVNYLANAPLRDSQQLIGQVVDAFKRRDLASVSRPLANLGIRAGTLYGLYALVGQDDPKAALRKALDILPWSGVVEGRGLPALSILAEKAGSLGRLAHDAAGAPITGKRLGEGEKAKLWYKAAPVAVQHGLDVSRGQGRRLVTTAPVRRDGD